MLLVGVNAVYSLETIWTTYQPDLQRFITRRVADTATAEDLLQEVYIKLHTHHATLRDAARMQAWLYQVARNAIYDYYRRRKSSVELTDHFAAETEIEDEITVRLASSVRAMVDLLPPDYREALLLTEFEGMAQKDLAQHLGISVSGAKSRVQRARKMLRELMEQCCAFEFDRFGKVIDYHPRQMCCAATQHPQ
jgi:RNA polymerase sigma-70 factor (ECF subfamily)